MPTAKVVPAHEEVARRVHQMTTSGISFDSFGKVREHELFGHATAGVAIALNVSLDDAKKILLASVA